MGIHFWFKDVGRSMKSPKRYVWEERTDWDSDDATEILQGSVRRRGRYRGAYQDIEVLSGNAFISSIDTADLKDSYKLIARVLQEDIRQKDKTSNGDTVLAA